jgi:hypothetical protein
MLLLSGTLSGIRIVRYVQQRSHQAPRIRDGFRWHFRQLTIKLLVSQLPGCSPRPYSGKFHHFSQADWRRLCLPSSQANSHKAPVGAHPDSFRPNIRAPAICFCNKGLLLQADGPEGDLIDLPAPWRHYLLTPCNTSLVYLTHSPSGEGARSGAWIEEGMSTRTMPGPTLRRRLLNSSQAMA